MQEHENSNKYIVQAQKVTMKFGGIVALNQIDILVENNSILGLIGPNGSGKTTFFNVLSGFYTPQEGKLLFDSQNITGMSTDKICLKGVARTFQNIRLFNSLTVLENVMLARHVRRRSSWISTLFGSPTSIREEREIKEKAWELLEKLNLLHYAEQKASALPYGAQRRLEIARALATEPKLLLLDEPAAGMNPQESLELMHFIGHIRDYFNLAIILIEHDMKVVMNVCEKIYVLEYGNIIAEGTASQIKTNQKVIDAYLGEEQFI